MINIVKTIVNKKLGVKVYVTYSDSGSYRVSAEDTDADEFLPATKIFPEYRRAVAYAKTIA